MPRSTVRKAKARTNKKHRRVAPSFHTIKPQLVTPRFRSWLLDKLESVRDARGRGDPATFTLTDGTKAQLRYAHEAGCRMGLRVTTLPRHIEFARHTDFDKREVLIQLVHTPKCGGMHFKQDILSKLAMPEPPSRKGIFPRCYRVYSNVHQCVFVFVNGHVPARNFCPHAIRVGMVREPVARIQSAFYYLCHGAYEKETDSRRRVLFNWDRRWRRELQRYPNLTSFLRDRNVVRRAMSLETGIEHFYPLTYWLCDDAHKPLVDFVIRQEHFDVDVQSFFTLLGVCAPPTTQRINVTRAKKTQATAVERKLVSTHYPNDSALFRSLSSQEGHARLTTTGNAKLRRVLRQLPRHLENTDFKNT